MIIPVNFAIHAPWRRPQRRFPPGGRLVVILGVSLGLWMLAAAIVGLVLRIGVP